MLPPKLPRISFGADTKPSMWVDEAIWGHRLYDDQTPWLTFLELLNVLVSEDKQGRGFKEPNGYNKLSYTPRRFLHLRNIVFNNPKLKKILIENSNDKIRWQAWENQMANQRSGVDEDSFMFVKSRFHTFDEFSWVIELLRSSAIEGNSNKQFTSKFIFPYGPDCLYEDLDERNFSPGRRFFARSGELAYLMLCRSAKGESILEKLRPIVFDEDKPLNKMVRALHLEDEPFREPHKHAYLPYAELPDYKDLAEDMISLMSCGMPGYDVLPNLVSILGLHLLLYFLKRAKEYAEGSSEIQLICEIIAPKKTVVRELSIDSYQTNNLYSMAAIKNYIDGYAETEEWHGMLAADDRKQRAIQIVKAHFDWQKDGDYAPDALMGALKRAASLRHSQHSGKIHSSWARSLGLASRRGTRSLRYAPTDSFIKSLVFTVVQGRMEYQTFLLELYNRYGLIIGHHQADIASLIGSKKGDMRAFTENSQRLEMRLVSLGLLKRLSDACAYVINPYIENK